MDLNFWISVTCCILVCIYVKYIWTKLEISMSTCLIFLFYSGECLIAHIFICCIIIFSIWHLCSKQNIPLLFSSKNIIIWRRPHESVYIDTNDNIFIWQGIYAVIHSRWNISNNMRNNMKINEMPKIVSILL